MPQVLEGIRVVDITSGPVGGIATMVLADFGADVVKVEPPGGDRFRALAAAPLWLRGKRTGTAGLLTDRGPRGGRAGRLGTTVGGAAVGRRRRRRDRAAARPRALRDHRLGTRRAARR